jgi:DNA-directed RNA polymerase specialized sigma54-like protein
MRATQTQSQSGRQSFAFQARLAGLLEMPARQYTELIEELEANPLFIKLKQADKKDRAIRTRRLKQTDLSSRFFELKEDLARDIGAGAPEVEKILQDKEKLLALIRKIGEEDFKKYFIFNEQELPVEEIASRFTISPAQVEEMLSLVNSVDLYSEFFVPSNLPESHISYNKVAVITRGSRGFGILFASAHWARGLYEIDYEKIEKMNKEGRFSRAERKELKKLLEKAEFLNIRKSILHGIITRTLKKQDHYLRSKGKAEMSPFLQADLAKDMEVHPSIISRSISGRSIETPWGEEKPLKEFFLSGRLKEKSSLLKKIENIIKEEKKPLSDKNIAEILRDSFAVKIAPRTVSKYRNELNLSSSFYRNPTKM